MATLLNEMRASFDSRYVCGSLAKGEITIWKTDPLSEITRVRPGFSGGGDRYAIDPINGLIYSGEWEGGLTCFSYKSGRKVWHRKDLIGIQRVDLSAAFPTSLFVALEAPDHRLSHRGVITGVIEVDTRTGKTLWTACYGDYMFLHPSAPFIVLQDRHHQLVRVLNEERQQMYSVPMENFAILDVAFAPDMIALAEGSKGIRMMDYAGNVLARHAPSERKPNCIRITFDGGHVCTFDSWDGAFVTIIESTTGRIIGEYERLTQAEICFIDRGARYLDRHGDICRTSDGKIIESLRL